MSETKADDSSLPLQDVKRLWDRIDSILPADYEASNERPGHIGGTLDPDHIYLVTQLPRMRGGFGQNLFSRMLGTPLESVRDQRRTARIGSIPDFPAYAAHLLGGTDRTRMYISDHLYTPIHPVDGNTTPIRHISGRFILSATTDMETIRETGIQFALAENLGGTQTADPLIIVDLHTRRPGFMAETFDESAKEKVGAYLSSHGVAVLESGLPPEQKAHIIDFCIDQAMAS